MKWFYERHPLGVSSLWAEIDRRDVWRVSGSDGVHVIQDGLHAHATVDEVGLQGIRISFMDFEMADGELIPSVPSLLAGQRVQLVATGSERALVFSVRTGGWLYPESGEGPREVEA